MRSQSLTITLVVALFSLLAAGFAGAQQIGDVYYTPVALGDADLDGVLTSRDSETMRDILFNGSPARVSDTALDFNRDGRFDLSDPTAVDVHLAGGGSHTPPVVQVKVMKGDANGDRAVNIADLAALMHWLTYGRMQNPCEASDVDGHAGLTSRDFDALRRYLFPGRDDGPPVGWTPLFLPEPPGREPQKGPGTPSFSN